MKSDSDPSEYVRSVLEETWTDTLFLKILE